MEPLIEAALDKARIDRIVQVEMTLPQERQVQLINFLWENTEVFMWSLRDMLGIDPNHQYIITDEVDKLLGVRFIVEMQNPQWFANVILIQTSNENWRMCVDYTNLNKACSNDSYPLL